MSREEVAAFLQHELQVHFAATKQSINHFAERAGVCSMTVSNMLSGETLYPRNETVRRVLHELGWRLIARPSW